MKKKSTKREPWVFTKSRKDALAKARKVHVHYVRVGEAVEARRGKK